MKYESNISSPQSQHMKNKKPFDIKKRTFIFALTIIQFTNDFKNINKEFVLSKQIMRSGTAVGALVREAHNGESDKDFIHKMAIAQKECDETIYWIELITNSDYQYDHKLRQEIHDEANQILKILRTIILNKKKNMTK